MTDDVAPQPAGSAPAGHVRHVPQGAYETGFLVLASLFVALLMLTNIIGTKLFAVPMDMPVFGPLLRAVDGLIQKLFEGQGGSDSLTLTAGIITYPATFLVTDIVSEIYGRRRADRMVWMGFAASLFMLPILAVGKLLPPSPFWEAGKVVELFGAESAGGLGTQAAQVAYEFTFDAPGTLLFASMTAYLCAQLVDNRLFHFWRRLSKGRYLWFRNNMSTTVSQLVDTIIVNVIFLYFHFGFSWGQIGAIIVAVYVVKASLAFLDTPLCYLGVFAARRLVDPERR